MSDDASSSGDRSMAQLERLGDRAIRFARPDGISARAIVRECRSWPGVIDVVVARDDVALYYEHEPAIDEARLAALASVADVAGEVRHHTLRVLYDGEDLAEVAAACGISVEDVIARHSSPVYTVAMMGFAPGFAYLEGLDAQLAAIARRSTPRPRVPAGAVGIAGGYTAVYPFTGPGGWNVIGRVIDTRMFDARGPLLGLGDRVRFVRWG